MHLTTSSYKKYKNFIYFNLPSNLTINYPKTDLSNKTPGIAKWESLKRNVEVKSPFKSQLIPSIILIWA